MIDSRQAVQERLDALEAEREALVGILEAYERLEALTQPEQGVSVEDRRPAPVPMPEAGDLPPVVVPPAPRHKKETFVCSRCPMTFKTKGWRDRHESKHPPVPDVAPSGGERLRRIPPSVRRGYEMPGQAVGA